MSAISNENLDKKGKGKLERLLEKLMYLISKVGFELLKLRLKLKVGFSKIANFFVREKGYQDLLGVKLEIEAKDYEIFKEQIKRLKGEILNMRKSGDEEDLKDLRILEESGGIQLEKITDKQMKELYNHIVTLEGFKLKKEELLKDIAYIYNYDKYIIENEIAEESILQDVVYDFSHFIDQISKQAQDKVDSKWMTIYILESLLDYVKENKLKDNEKIDARDFIIYVKSQFYEEYLKDFKLIKGDKQKLLLNTIEGCDSELNKQMTKKQEVRNNMHTMSREVVNNNESKDLNI